MTFIVETDPIDRFEQRRNEHAAKHLPSADELAAKETERHARRQEIRERIARHELASAEYVQRQNDAERVESEKEALADLHCQACAPIQAELRDIETKQIKLVSRRQPTDKDLESRQAELLKELHERNEQLETAIAVKDRLLARMRDDNLEVRERMKDSAARNELITTGRRDLVLAMTIAQRELDLADNRLRHANDMRPRWPADYFEAEIAAANAALRAAKEKTEAAFEAVINE